MPTRCTSSALRKLTASALAGLLFFPGCSSSSEDGSNSVFCDEVDTCPSALSSLFTDVARLSALEDHRISSATDDFTIPDTSILTVKPPTGSECEGVVFVLVQWAEETFTERSDAGVQTSSGALGAFVRLDASGSDDAVPLSEASWEFVYSNEMYAEDLTDAKRNEFIDFGWPPLGTAFALGSDCRWVPPT